jgi:hypothetical protein
MVHNASSQNIWDCSTYPDEAGFQERSKPMLERIAADDFGQRSLAESKCPDTGLPVKVWAVKGETIISPYTGRAYIQQGETGYFGPKKRNEKGEIIAFGGDPLKYDLPPVTASLLLNKDVERAKAFVSIPGNMRQQYHFACKNWARFYPLLADGMGDEWKSNFYYWVGKYAESRRPSDGNRQWLPLSKAHNLIGEPGELLGGNTKDGGTENHKTMWRTSALLYAQLFPDSAKISGYTPAETENLVKPMLVEYMKRILQTGNGEYDSQVYYPHSIPGFLNLYDFSPDEETRMLAKFMLDYYFVTYGLKDIDGTIAGPQKRGYLANGNPGEMETLLWMYFNRTSRNMNDAQTIIHQATTNYRPNQIICDIVSKNLSLPFEGKMSRPFYHMDYAHAFAETFYCSDSYALGNMQMTIVDNPNQQMVWSLVAEGSDGPLCFSGGHPMRASTSGHSPYTQTLQSKGTLVVLTAPTKILENADTLVAPNYSKITRPNLWHLPGSEQGKNFEIKNRQKYGQAPLQPLRPLKDKTPEAYEAFFTENQGSASSWLYYPRNLKPQKMEGMWVFEANKAFVAVIPLGNESFLMEPDEHLLTEMNRRTRRFFTDYSLLVVPGNISGYVIETGEKSRYKTSTNFVEAIKTKSKIDKAKMESEFRVKIETLQNDKLEMQYIPEGLRCQAIINGKKQNWDKHTRGAVYDTPYIKVKNGKMMVSNGREGYSVEFIDDKPVWKILKTK